MEDTVTIPRSEYDRLVGIAEDAADARAIEEFRARLAQGDEEFLPAEFVNRMIEGESVLRLWREHRGLSQSELSRRAGVNRVQIADIEAGRRNGSVETFRKLAQALGVTIDDLV